METVGTFDAKNRLSALLDKVEQGEEVVITRHGKPVARLVGVTEDFDRQKARQAADNLRKLKASLPKDTLKGLSVREMIEEGRR